MEGNIRIIRSQQPEYLEVLALRQAVLRAPLGMNLYEEDLTSELDAQFFIYSAGNEIIGCILALPTDYNTLRLKQMAVSPDHQKKGIGQALIEAVETFATANGYTKLFFHARESAIPFYEKLGFQVLSDTFEEVGIPHKKMGKNLA